MPTLSWFDYNTPYNNCCNNTYYYIIAVFFITTNETPWLDGKHVVFGIIIDGYNIIEKIQNVDISSYSNCNVKNDISKLNNQSG